jgi:hypothetical protein
MIPLLHVYSHLVVASKFVLPPTSHVVRGSLCTYELSLEVLASIHEGTFLTDLMLVNNGYQHHLNIDHMPLKI